MAEAHDTVLGAHGAGGHVGPTVNAYLVVFGALAIFTAVSFGVNAVTRDSPHVGAAIILLVAVVKATLVGMFFMHLKFDWSKLYFLVFPVLILTTMLLIVLLPDFVIDWHVE